LGSGVEGVCRGASVQKLPRWKVQAPSAGKSDGRASGALLFPEDTMVKTAPSTMWPETAHEEMRAFAIGCRCLQRKERPVTPRDATNTRVQEQPLTNLRRSAFVSSTTTQGVLSAPSLFHGGAECSADTVVSPCQSEEALV
jgi:hypothetical protein